ncbi:MAG: DUF167 domain-containing protein [Chloracidobacterium sp.]|nr:DUF167 domain-containing protein [Chloracidobacterium sp.]MCO5333477.1 DUF167 domain-containing protein [Pyrinomonadaceae bacterium]
MIEYSENDRSVTFSVTVVPRASVTKIVGEHNGTLKLRIAAPPVDGAANREVTSALAKAFGVPRSAVEIIGGQTSKLKRVQINGAAAAKIAAILQAESAA